MTVVFGYAGKKSANKYKAKLTEVDGITFASKKEAKRYVSLKLMEHAGRIKDLELHPKYDLMVNGVRIGRYTADFRYLELEHPNWKLIVEDVKGYSKWARDYPLRKKLMLAIHGVAVRET